MPPIDTRVQTLNLQTLNNLRGLDEATTQRVMALVEEAVRSAALEGALPGRVSVIRELDVGAFSRATSPASLAVAVEAAVQRLASNAVSADDPAAGIAPMVYFKDEASAVLSLAQRVASNKPTTEWFWPSVVKDWTPQLPVERAIPLLIERAVSTSSGVVTLARVVETLAATGVLDRLLERLSPSDGRALLEAIGWTDVMVNGGGEARRDADLLAPQMPARSHGLAQRWLDRWGGDTRDPRALWLGAMLLVADRPARATNAELPEVVRVWLASVLEQASSDDGVRNDAATRTVQREDLIADARAWLQSQPRSPLDSLFGGGPPAPLTARDPAPTTKRAERRAADDESHDAEHAADDPPVWKHPRPTNYAGFLLLVPLLTRTGLANIVGNDPGLIERDWPTALLLRLARRLGVPRDDPAIAWTTTRPLVIAHADRPMTAEVMRAARIRVRNEASLTLRQLIHRSGAIVATAGNIDVLLERDAIDTVRCAGLDVDPDSRSWLGRTVQFHWLDAVDVNA